MLLVLARHAQKYNMLIVTIHLTCVFTFVGIFFFINLIRGLIVSLSALYSTVLVSPGLECPGVSLVEVCATCLRCHLW